MCSWMNKVRESRWRCHGCRGQRLYLSHPFSLTQMDMSYQRPANKWCTLLLQAKMQRVLYLYPSVCIEVYLRDTVSPSLPSILHISLHTSKRTGLPGWVICVYTRCWPYSPTMNGRVYVASRCRANSIHSGSSGEWRELASCTHAHTLDKLTIEWWVL